MRHVEWIALVALAAGCVEVPAQGDDDEGGRADRVDHVRYQELLQELHGEYVRTGKLTYDYRSAIQISSDGWVKTWLATREGTPWGASLDGQLRIDECERGSWGWECACGGPGLSPKGKECGDRDFPDQGMTDPDGKARFFWSVVYPYPGSDPPGGICYEYHRQANNVMSLRFCDDKDDSQNYVMVEQLNPDGSKKF